eukprot:9468775-Pyramimonas_sp.AAC.1
MAKFRGYTTPLPPFGPLAHYVPPRAVGLRWRTLRGGYTTPPPPRPRKGDGGAPGMQDEAGEGPGRSPI